ncbi:MAG: 4-(cytidine 5'-diphospho)-2-C-methyl-D-erythritol kinase [Candidatus Omnitrophica bacterium]|nr:4-(cytidine 5'-diphospho)-2-C-methyl-D-erythritol kinase [Candidatus Omnitrophota bacterium]
MDSITVKAPAKVNLFLKVLGKRKDSYHNIHTVFERISLADTIKISKIPKGIVVRSDKPITLDAKDNLCFKAAEAVLKRGKIRSGVKIEIKKRIPVASGLGGGSSDAAATIIGVNRLFGLKLENKALSNIGRRLGADVPFFLLDTPFAIGRGRGDVLEAIRSGNKLWHLIVKAGNKTSTKDIYRAFDRASKHLTPRMESDKIRIPSKLRMDYALAESILHNDLERAVSLKKGVISRISKSLAQLLCKRMIISGSGPSLFCLYRTRREAIRARDVVLRSVSAPSRTGWQIFVA